MKNIKLIIVLLFCSWFYSQAQVTTPLSDRGLQLSLRGGYDFPQFNNNTPYIDYKAGPLLGVSLDYYWTWYGLGFDFDYINNGTKNTYPIDNLFNASGVLLNSFTIQEDKITRMFYGIGPDFRYLSNSKKFQAELNTRIGLSTIKGGLVEVRETSTSTNQLLNFHAGYDLNSSLAAKAQIRMTYFFNHNFGIHLGAYYLKHFDGTELVDSSNGISAGYVPFSSGGTGVSGPSRNILSSSGLTSRVDPCNCDISSFGVFGGLTYKFSSEKTSKCNTCGCKVSITAKDKYTGEILPDTDVILLNSTGQAVNSGKTNAFGIVVFDSCKPDNYTIKGVLNSVNLQETTISIKELSDCEKNNGVVSKEILYTDRNFIIKGRAFECNSTKPIAGINVVLENNALAIKKSTMTDAQGNFMLQLPETGTFELYGRKENYFSQIEMVTADNYNRDKNLFVKLEMCAEKVDCGRGLNLKNILFDLDKFEIKPAAKMELNRLVRFLSDNPKVSVEVGSHTDCRSSHAYNQTLSQNRANASVDYVVSRGISRSRISGKGYGETVLLNRCADNVDCSEAEHSINRRTEMKVICPE